VIPHKDYFKLWENVFNLVVLLQDTLIG